MIYIENKYYAGIGSRETPQYILNYFEKVATFLAKRGFILRSGGAKGADQAFEKGCNKVNGKKEIYLPWKGFEGSNSDLVVTLKEAFEIAEQFHPYWSKLSEGAKKLQARNSHQVFGKELDNLSDFILCWTKNGKGEGGTGQAIRIAKAYNIPIFDAGNYADLSEMKLALRQFFLDNKILSEEDLNK